MIMTRKWYPAIKKVAEFYYRVRGLTSKAQVEANLARIASNLTRAEEKALKSDLELSAARNSLEKERGARTRAEYELDQTRNLTAHLKEARKTDFLASLRVKGMRGTDTFLFDEGGNIYGQTAASRIIHGDLVGRGDYKKRYRLENFQYNPNEQLAIFKDKLYKMTLTPVKRVGKRPHQYATLEEAPFPKVLARAKKQGGDALREALSKLVRITRTEVEARPTTS
jgi:hypothetical protein